jgi:catechol 2,3-dioxygenase-like lactoylglutathione lyase family enzyme
VAIFTHVVVGTNDLDKAVKFYDAALAPLGVTRLGPLGDHAFMYGTAEGPEFLVTKPANGQPACFANGGTIGFKAPTRKAVHEFHDGGLANGGSDEGQPGPRAFAPTAYASYLRDPDGNKICTYCFAEE